MTHFTMCNILNKLKITNYKYVKRQTTVKNYEKTKH